MKPFLVSLVGILAWLAAGSFGLFLLTLAVTDLVTEPDVWAAMRTFVFAVALFAVARAPFVHHEDEDEDPA